MNRNLPTINRLVSEREKVREHELHYKRLRNIKSNIDNRKPKVPSHIKTRGGKKEQLIVEKVNEIQRENRILLKKMLTIDLKPTKHNPGKIKMAPTPSSYSLNRAQRIRELTRVTQENKMLLQRLQSAHSVYNKEKWEKDFKKKKYHEQMLRKNADRYCQHPYFVMASEPRVMSATGTQKFGYSTMPIKANHRARSNYSQLRKGKKRKRRLMTAGHARKRSDVGSLPKGNRPITAKGPIIGRRPQTKAGPSTGGDDAFRPETVPYTNIGPLGECEPADENDKIKQEITREVTGESEREIEARIADEVKEEPEQESEFVAPQDKFNEKEKQMDNLTDDLSNNKDKDNQNSDDEESKHDNNQKQENENLREGYNSDNEASDPENKKQENSGENKNPNQQDPNSAEKPESKDKIKSDEKSDGPRDKE